MHQHPQRRPGRCEPSADLSRDERSADHWSALRERRLPILSGRRVEATPSTRRRWSSTRRLHSDLNAATSRGGSPSSPTRAMTTWLTRMPGLPGSNSIRSAASRPSGAPNPGRARRRCHEQLVGRRRDPSREVARRRQHVDAGWSGAGDGTGVAQGGPKPSGVVMRVVEHVGADAGVHQPIELGGGPCGATHVHPALRSPLGLQQDRQVPHRRTVLHLQDQAEVRSRPRLVPEGGVIADDHGNVSALRGWERLDRACQERHEGAVQLGLPRCGPAPVGEPRGRIGQAPEQGPRRPAAERAGRIRMAHTSAIGP